MTARRVLAGVSLLMAVAAPLGSQTIRGTVVDRADAPIPGVVVQLLDSASTVTARALSNDRGEFRIAAPRAGTYQLRSQRIGYRPVTSDRISLRIGEESAQRLVLSNILIALDTVRVTDRNACRAFTDSGAATFAVWEQVRTALTATQLTASARVIAATTVAYDRSLDPNGRRVLRQTTTVSSDYVKQPWRTIAPDLLRRDGFVVTTKDNSTIYYAPGLDMLLSPGFVEDHCFRLARERDRLGIAFEPAPDRKHVAEIRGTLWLDRKSLELRSLEYRYANIPSEQADEARGDMEFVRLRTGAWAITKWAIRMPVLENRVASQSFGGQSIRTTGLQVVGGELALVRRGADTLWSRPTVVMSGIVLDSVSQQPVQGALVTLSGTLLRATTDARGRFTISNVLQGEYTAEVRTASLDSASAVFQGPVAFVDSATTVELRVPTAAQLSATVCGGKSLAAPGIVLGTAQVIGDTAIAPVVTVAAEWSEIGVRSSVAGVSTENDRRRLETRADAHGVFRLCGVPVNTALSIRATSGGTAGSPVSIRIPEGGRFARASVSVNRAAPALASLAGVVLVDSTHEPIVGADVSLSDLSKTVLTDARGAFRFTDLPAGEHSLVVRHVGFGPVDTRIEVSANQTNDRRIYLSRTVMLDSVVVVAAPIDRRMQEFEDNRKIGLGHFLVREDLERMSGRTMAAVMSQFTGVVIINGHGSVGYLSTNRARTRCQPIDGPCLVAERLYWMGGDVGDHPGAKPGTCYAQVYLDNMLMNPGRPTEPFDLGTLQQSQLEAIEYYESPLVTPTRYNTRAAQCGVLVAHTRRSP